MVNAKLAVIVAVAAFVGGAFSSSPDLRAFAANTIGSADIIDNSILSIDIKDGEVKTADLASNAVTSAKVKDGEIKNSDLGASAVTAAKIKDGEVKSAEISDNSIAGVDMNQTFMKFGFKEDALNCGLASYCWNPNGVNTTFFIFDSAAKDGSAIVATVNNGVAVTCSPSDPNGNGFWFRCTNAPSNGAFLDYVIINKP